ncbi:CRISPR-associated protein Cas5 [Neisseria bacilliformis]|nr:CRISPR-associated protein Cas5 [Neisseria bacilliformis]
MFAPHTTNQIEVLSAPVPPPSTMLRAFSACKSEKRGARPLNAAPFCACEP